MVCAETHVRFAVQETKAAIVVGAGYPGGVRSGTEVFAGAPAFAKHADHLLREYFHVALKTGDDEGLGAHREGLMWDIGTEVVACTSQARSGDRAGIFSNFG